MGIEPLSNNLLLRLFYLEFYFHWDDPDSANPIRDIGSGWPCVGCSLFFCVLFVIVKGDLVTLVVVKMQPMQSVKMVVVGDGAVVCFFEWRSF